MAGDDSDDTELSDYAENAPSRRSLAQQLSIRAGSPVESSARSELNDFTGNTSRPPNWSVSETIVSLMEAPGERETACILPCLLNQLSREWDNDICTVSNLVYLTSRFYPLAN